MNLNIIIRENQTQSLLLSLTKTCETLIHQTRARPEKTLEFKLTRPRQTFLLNPNVSV